MRRRTSAVGALLILLAVFLYFNQSLMIPLSSSLGQMGTETVFSTDKVIPIAPQSYGNYNASLMTGDTLAVTLTSNPGGIDVLLMNQGNFSLWSSSSKGSYFTYPESHLQVSNYSFTFTSTEKTQEFYVVLVSHSTTPTEVLLQATSTRPSEESLLLFPLVSGFVGIVLLWAGVRGGGKSEGAQKKGAAATQAPPTQASPSKAEGEFCRHCGAALRPGSQFCPACNRSQL